MLRYLIAQLITKAMYPRDLPDPRLLRQAMKEQERKQKEKENKS